ncbi:MAG: RHS repeat-associated core domain-containing protein [Paracoccaceae bacterium]
MPTGIPVHYDPEFALDGLIPITITSSWYGNIVESGPLGRGRVAEVDATIRRKDDGGFTYTDEDGFAINFPAPTPIPDGWVDGDTTRNTRLMQGPRRSLLFRENGITQTFAKGDDGIWRVTRMEDRRGNALTYDRGEGGRLDRIGTPEGLSLHFTYNAYGLRTEVALEGTDGTRVTVMRYAYQGDLLVLAEAPHGERHTFSYDDRGLIAAVDRNGAYQASFEHDAKRRRTRVSASTRAKPAEFRYDDAARITTYLPGGDEARAEHFHATQQDTIAQTVNALGIETRTVENAEGRVAQTIDGEGNATSTTYDADGNIASATDAEGRHTTYVWDGDGQIALIVDNAGHAWEYDYDEKGSLIAVQTPLGHITDIRNNDAGQPIGICRQDGFIQEFTYDDHHRLAQVMDFNGAISRFQRDSFGRVTAIIAADGSQTQFVYEEQPGLAFTTPARVIRPDGVETQTQVARQGTEITQINGEGQATTYRYDGLMNLLSVTDPRGGTLTFAHDDENRLQTVTNQQGRRWTFTRDGAGRIVRESDFDGRVMEFTHDKADRVISTRHPDGRVVAMEWDKSGLLLKRSVTIPGHVEPYDETYDYDERGLLVRTANAGAVVDFSYDDAGRLIAEAVNGVAVESVLDCCGNRKERRIGAHHAVYHHDPLGALTGLVLNDRPVLRITTDAFGRDMLREGADGYALSHQYDSVGQLIHQVAQGRFTRPDTALPVDRQRSFAWDRAVAPTAMIDPLWGMTQYQSDPNGQVLTAAHGVTTGPTPILAGQRPPEVERFAYSPTLDICASADAAGAYLSWSASDGGRVTAARGQQGERILFTYDACGRTIERRVEQNGFRPQVWRFTWDGFDRLIGVVCPDDAAWAYVHDPLGRRIEKRLLRPGAGPKAASTRFVWDGNVIAAEIPLAGGQTPDLTRAVWWHFEPQGFTPLLREEGAKILHVIADHLGTPRELVSESGEVVWAADYRLWGGVRGLWTAAGGNAAEDLSLAWRAPGPSEARALCPIRFQGQWEDAETGLHYNRYRTYDPASAQYLSPDPIGIAGGTRSAGYVPSPTVFVDVLGLYGVYLFQVPGGKCYVGKGEPARMLASMIQRSRARSANDARLRCTRKTYHNTDAAAAAAGMTPQAYGALVENQLLTLYGAKASPDWLNVKLDGQTAFANATAAQQASATATAQAIKAGFGAC